MSGYSSVGTSGAYEAGDQRNVKKSEIQHAERYNEGQPGSHIGNDSSKYLHVIVMLVSVLTMAQKINAPLQIG